MHDIETKTVDGFQGKEKDLILFSTTRSAMSNGKPNPKKTIGFLRDQRRMNVGLSRARLCLIVCGDLKQLNLNEKWKNLIDYSIGMGSCY